MNGDQRHPLYSELTKVADRMVTRVTFVGILKFLVGRDGNGRSFHPKGS